MVKFSGNVEFFEAMYQETKKDIAIYFHPFSVPVPSPVSPPLNFFLKHPLKI